MEQSQKDEHCPAALRDEKAAFGALLSVMLARYSLAEFEPEQTDLFIRGWYLALVKRGWVAILAGKVSKIIIAHKDRLLRFGSEIIFKGPST